MAVDFSNPRFEFTAADIRKYREDQRCGIFEAKEAFRKKAILTVLQELKCPHFYNSHEDRFNELIDVVETLVEEIM